MWAQSPFFLVRLLLEGFLAPGELDQLDRRLSSNLKPDVVVQVVTLTEKHRIQEKLRQLDFTIHTVNDLVPLRCNQPECSHIYLPILDAIRNSNCRAVSRVMSVYSLQVNCIHSKTASLNLHQISLFPSSLFYFPSCRLH